MSKARKSFSGDAEEGPSTKSKKDKETLPLDHVPKEYGSHNGQRHSVILMKGSFENLKEATPFLNHANTVMSIVEGTKGIPLGEWKHRYQVNRDKITDHYAGIYGHDLGPRERASYNDECNSFSFDYVCTQVVVIMYSTEKFPHSSKDEARGMYVAAFPCKCLYTSNILSKEEILSLKRVARTGEKPAHLATRSSFQFGGALQKSDKGHSRYKADSARGAKEDRNRQRTVDPDSWVDIRVANETVLSGNNSSKG